MLLLLAEEEGAFELPKTLMGRWKLTQWGQMRVGETHHSHQWDTEEQWSQPFTADSLAFYSVLTDLVVLPSLQSVLGVYVGLGTS